MMNSMKIIGRWLVAPGLTIAVAALLTAPCLADAANGSGNSAPWSAFAGQYGGPDTSSTTTSGSMDQSTGATSNMVATTAYPNQTPDMTTDMTATLDYGVLANPWLDHFAIVRAQDYGCGDRGVAWLAKISSDAGVPMDNLVDRVETGTTIPNLALEYGLASPSEDSINDWKHRVWMYETAYHNTGVKAFVRTHPVYMAEAYGPTSMVAGYSATLPTGGFVESLSSAGGFTILVRALRSTGLAATLRTGGPYTFFAPTDGAFGKLPAGTLDAWMADPTAFTTILQYHVIPGRIMSTDIVSMTTPTTPVTLQGTALTVATTNGVTMINSTAAVTRPDITTRDGVIHGIDNVLLPPGTTLPVNPSASTVPAMGAGGFVETLNAAGGFSILVRALQSTGLAATLRTGGPYTVLAPTDAAFGKLPTGTVDALMANPTQLATILQYHVIPGRIMSADIVSMTSPNTPDTLQGSSLTVATANGVTTFNGTANVTRPDIATRDGVIHGIDTVLIPPGTTLPVAP